MNDSQIRELLYLVHLGEKEAFNEIYNYYYKVTKAIAYKMNGTNSYLDVEDLIQVGLSNFDKVINNYREDFNITFSTYISVCITRRMQSALKQSYEKPTASFDYTLDDNKNTLYDIVADEKGVYSPYDKLANNEAWDSIENVLKTHMSKRDYQIFKMYIHGFDVDEISSHTSLTKKAVYGIVYRTMKKLRLHLAKNSD